MYNISYNGFGQETLKRTVTVTTLPRRTLEEAQLSAANMKEVAENLAATTSPRYSLTAPYTGTFDVVNLPIPTYEKSGYAVTSKSISRAERARWLEDATHLLSQLSDWTIQDYTVCGLETPCMTPEDAATFMGDGWIHLNVFPRPGSVPGTSAPAMAMAAAPGKKIWIGLGIGLAGLALIGGTAAIIASRKHTQEI